VKLNKVEAMLLNGAEECRRRAMTALDQGGDPIIVAQDLASAAESYQEASNEIALRARKAVARG
jgi:hypothetical protein